jgi:hypothetical protein
LILTGACHCGAVSYELLWPDPFDAVPARRCSCSYCTRFNGTWTSHPDASLIIDTSAGPPPGRYRFGTGTADFLFCKACGVTVAALCDTSGGQKAVVNINTLDDGQNLDFDHSDSDFDDESLAQRLDRRMDRWIGTVKLI